MNVNFGLSFNRRNASLIDVIERTVCKFNEGIVPPGMIWPWPSFRPWSSFKRAGKLWLLTPFGNWMSPAWRSSDSSLLISALEKVMKRLSPH